MSYRQINNEICIAHGWRVLKVPDKVTEEEMNEA